MINAVNTQALASSVSASRAEKPASDPPESRGKGDLTAQDLQAGIVKFSSEASLLATAGGAARPSAQDVLTVPTDDGGKAAAQPAKAAAPQPQPQVQQDAAPASAGGQPSASAAASTEAASASSSAKTYEPADANEDGTVTPQEQQAYDAKVAAEKATLAAVGSSRIAEADAAARAYAKVEQLGKDSNSSGLAAT